MIILCIAAAGISVAMSGPKKHAFRLPSQPEFVFEEEAAVKRRGWGENLQFYTGIGYLSGAGMGGVCPFCNSRTV
jgi:mitochondrial import inner membrane translocase subunit TIM23